MRSSINIFIVILLICGLVSVRSHAEIYHLFIDHLDVSPQQTHLNASSIKISLSLFRVPDLPEDNESLSIGG